jgi:hypothetical protein
MRAHEVHAVGAGALATPHNVTDNHCDVGLSDLHTLP